MKKNHYEYLIVSKDKRLPLDVANSGSTNYKIVDTQEFLTIAQQVDGFEYDKALLYNVDSLTESIYIALSDLESVIYYKWSDYDDNLDFVISQNIRVYKAPEPTVEKVEENYNVEPPKKYDKELEIKSNVEVKHEDEDIKYLDSNDFDNQENNSQALIDRWDLLLSNDEAEVETKKGVKPARVILFGSSKGGTGKTFTSLLTAYRYAKTHPNQRVAFADFDIIDGQVGITLMKVTPTILEYYKQYAADNREFKYLNNVAVKSEYFSHNIEFYLAPHIENPAVTEDDEFWTDVFQKLIVNYDVVFFDSGIDYLGKPPISKLYKIADKILLTCNTSINSVKSVIKQIKTLAGVRKNAVFLPEDKIAEKISVILTRVSPNSTVNQQVVKLLQQNAPVVAAFGNLDDQIHRTQWYQQWNIWDSNEAIMKSLDKIAE